MCSIMFSVLCSSALTPAFSFPPVQDLFMASVLESEAVFAVRAGICGIDQTTLTLMRAQGWITLGTFGFACAYVPGAGDDTSFKEDVMKTLFGAGTHLQGPGLRRLYFESYSMCASELRGRLDKTADEAPKRLPLPEREDRYKKLANAVPGLRLSGIRG